jgi:glycosyltransferase involved in cell wall biosynthesis
MDSLLAQTYVPIEIVVIDDCSPDNSVEILRRYESQDNVQLVVRESNGGWVRVSNQGAELARGEFLLFANCDDACVPAMIAALVTALAAHPSAGIAFCRSLLIDDEDGVITNDFEMRERSFKAYCQRDVLIPRSLMARFLLVACVIPNLSAALFRRDAFFRAGALPSDFRACSDWDLFFRVVRTCDVAYVASPMNLFRQHGNTIRSTTRDRVTIEEYLRLLLGHLRTIDMDVLERSRYRTEAMFLWAVHLLRPSIAGIRNFRFHLKTVIAQDPVALVLLPAGIVWRAAQIVWKLGSGQRAAAME